MCTEWLTWMINRKRKRGQFPVLHPTQLLCGIQGKGPLTINALSDSESKHVHQLGCGPACGKVPFTVLFSQSTASIININHNNSVELSIWSLIQLKKNPGVIYTKNFMISVVCIVLLFKMRVCTDFHQVFHQAIHSCGIYFAGMQNTAKEMGRKTAPAKQSQVKQ